MMPVSSPKAATMMSMLPRILKIQKTQSLRLSLLNLPIFFLPFFDPFDISSFGVVAVDPDPDSGTTSQSLYETTTSNIGLPPMLIHLIQNPELSLLIGNGKFGNSNTESEFLKLQNESQDESSQDQRQSLHNGKNLQSIAESNAIALSRKSSKKSLNESSNDKASNEDTKKQELFLEHTDQSIQLVRDPTVDIQKNKNHKLIQRGYDNNSKLNPANKVQKVQIPYDSSILHPTVDENWRKDPGRVWMANALETVKAILKTDIDNAKKAEENKKIRRKEIEEKIKRKIIEIKGSMEKKEKGFEKNKERLTELGDLAELREIDAKPSSVIGEVLRNSGVLKKSATFGPLSEIEEEAEENRVQSTSLTKEKSSATLLCQEQGISYEEESISLREESEYTSRLSQEEKIDEASETFKFLERNLYADEYEEFKNILKDEKTSRQKYNALAKRLEKLEHELTSLKEEEHQSFIGKESEERQEQNRENSENIRHLDAKLLQLAEKDSPPQDSKLPIEKYNDALPRYPLNNALPRYPLNNALPRYPLNTQIRRSGYQKDTVAVVSNSMIILEVYIPDANGWNWEGAKKCTIRLSPLIAADLNTVKNHTDVNDGTSDVNTDDDDDDTENKVDDDTENKVGDDTDNNKRNRDTGKNLEKKTVKIVENQAQSKTRSARIGFDMSFDLFDSDSPSKEKEQKLKKQILIPDVDEFLTSLQHNLWKIKPFAPTLTDFMAHGFRDHPFGFGKFGELQRLESLKKLERNKSFQRSKSFNSKKSDTIKSFKSFSKNLSTVLSINQKYKTQADTTIQMLELNYFPSDDVSLKEAQYGRQALKELRSLVRYALKGLDAQSADLDNNLERGKNLNFAADLSNLIDLIDEKLRQIENNETNRNQGEKNQIEDTIEFKTPDDGSRKVEAWIWLESEISERSQLTGTTFSESHDDNVSDAGSIADSQMSEQTRSSFFSRISQTAAQVFRQVGKAATVSGRYHKIRLVKLKDPESENKLLKFKKEEDLANVQIELSGWNGVKIPLISPTQQGEKTLSEVNLQRAQTMKSIPLKSVSHLNPISEMSLDSEGRSTESASNLKGAQQGETQLKRMKTMSVRFDNHGVTDPHNWSPYGPDSSRMDDDSDGESHVPDNSSLAPLTGTVDDLKHDHEDESELELADKIHNGSNESDMNSANLPVSLLKADSLKFPPVGVVVTPDSASLPVSMPLAPISFMPPTPPSSLPSTPRIKSGHVSNHTVSMDVSVQSSGLTSVQLKTQVSPPPSSDTPSSVPEMAPDMPVPGTPPSDMRLESMQADPSFAQYNSTPSQGVSVHPETISTPFPNDVSAEKPSMIVSAVTRPVASIEQTVSEDSEKPATSSLMDQAKILVKQLSSTLSDLPRQLSDLPRQISQTASPLTQFLTKVPGQPKDNLERSMAMRSGNFTRNFGSEEVHYDLALEEATNLAPGQHGAKERYTSTGGTLNTRGKAFLGRRFLTGGLVGALMTAAGSVAMHQRNLNKTKSENFNSSQKSANSQKFTQKLPGSYRSKVPSHPSKGGFGNNYISGKQNARSTQTGNLLPPLGVTNGAKTKALSSGVDATSAESSESSLKTLNSGTIPDSMTKNNSNKHAATNPAWIYIAGVGSGTSIVLTLLLILLCRKKKKDFVDSTVEDGQNFNSALASRDNTMATTGGTTSAAGSPSGSPPGTRTTSVDGSDQTQGSQTRGSQTRGSQTQRGNEADDEQSTGDPVQGDVSGDTRDQNIADQNAVDQNTNNVDQSTQVDPNTLETAGDENTNANALMGNNCDESTNLTRENTTPLTRTSTANSMSQNYNLFHTTSTTIQGDCQSDVLIRVDSTPFLSQVKSQESLRSKSGSQQSLRSCSKSGSAGSLTNSHKPDGPNDKPNDPNEIGNANDIGNQENQEVPLSNDIVSNNNKSPTTMSDKNTRTTHRSLSQASVGVHSVGPASVGRQISDSLSHASVGRQISDMQHVGRQISDMQQPQDINRYESTAQLKADRKAAQQFFIGTVSREDWGDFHDNFHDNNQETYNEEAQRAALKKEWDDFYASESDQQNNAELEVTPDFNIMNHSNSNSSRNLQIHSLDTGDNTVNTTVTPYYTLTNTDPRNVINLNSTSPNGKSDKTDFFHYDTTESHGRSPNGPLNGAGEFLHHDTTLESNGNTNSGYHFRAAEVMHDEDTSSPMHDEDTIEDSQMIAALNRSMTHFSIYQPRTVSHDPRSGIVDPRSGLSHSDINQNSVHRSASFRENQNPNNPNSARGERINNGERITKGPIRVVERTASDTEILPTVSSISVIGDATPTMSSVKFDSSFRLRHTSASDASASNAVSRDGSSASNTVQANGTVIPGVTGAAISSTGAAISVSSIQERFENRFGNVAAMSSSAAGATAAPNKSLNLSTNKTFIVGESNRLSGTERPSFTSRLSASNGNVGAPGGPARASGGPSPPLVQGQEARLSIPRLSARSMSAVSASRVSAGNSNMDRGRNSNMDRRNTNIDRLTRFQTQSTIGLKSNMSSWQDLDKVDLDKVKDSEDAPSSKLDRLVTQRSATDRVPFLLHGETKMLEDITNAMQMLEGDMNDVD